jgi:hypothetical protein
MNNYFEILTIILLVWTLVLTILVSYVFVFFRKLSKTVGGQESLTKTLSKILDIQNSNTEAIGDIQKLIRFLKSDGESHIQKIGLVKYNPFAEMGGDHSFSLSVLNGRDSGFVLTALHTRDRTRIYIKEVDKGKSLIELSEHELKAMEKAKKK